MFSPFTLGRRQPTQQLASPGKLVPLRPPQPSQPPRDPSIRIT
ncbi:hypothetical protein [Chitinimonas naiadis]